MGMIYDWIRVMLVMLLCLLFMVMSDACDD